MTEIKPVERLGVFGGTFDPVHLAHIELAKRAIDQGQLGGLILVPCFQSPHKGPTQASNAQRIDMLKLASAELKNVDICDYELNKPSISYTIETLEFLAEKHSDKQLVFCLGEDSLRGFTLWRRWQDILGIAHLAVMSRDLEAGTNVKNMSGNDVFAERTVSSVDKIQKKTGQVLGIKAPKMPISASLIRERIEICAHDSKQQFEQDPVLGAWLSPKVLEYIVENKVYQ